MEATKPRLGRGLDALISGDNGNGHGPARLEIGRIQQNPYQPRKQFDDDELAQLAESIKAHGILQPLVVRASGETFQLIAGERRLKAAQLAGLAEVPVHFVEFDDQQVFEAALAENIQRTDLNPIEKAIGFKDYLDRFGHTQDQLAAKLGIDRTSVANLIGLLNLAPTVQDAVRIGQVSLGHAKVLKGIADADRQAALCKQVVAPVPVRPGVGGADQGTGRGPDRGREAGEGGRRQAGEDGPRQRPGERPPAEAGRPRRHQGEGPGQGPDRPRVRDQRRLRTADHGTSEVALRLANRNAPPARPKYRTGGLHSWYPESDPPPR